MTDDQHGSRSPAKYNSPENSLGYLEAAPVPKLFLTPQILLAACYVNRMEQRVAALSTDDSIDFISGSSMSRIRISKIFQGEKIKSTEFTGWLLLLESLHQTESELQKHECYDRDSQTGIQNARGTSVSPAVRFHQTTWDFLPPGVVRPMAMITISDIAIIARRLGMTWEEFNPEGGSMRARGNGQGVFSTLARPIGILLQYTHLEGGVTLIEKSKSPIDERSSVAELYIPAREADMMGFGILPGCDVLNVPNFKLGTTAEVYAAMDMLDSTRKASAKLKDVNNLLMGKWDAHCMYGFSDIVALAAPMIRRRHSTIVRVPTPAEYCSSLLSCKECFVVFSCRLKEYLRSEVTVFEQGEWVLNQYEQLNTLYRDWEDQAENNDLVNGRDLIFLEAVHDRWDATTDYFVQIEKTHQLHYLDLMASHISHAVNYWGDAWHNLKNEKARDSYGLRALESEGSHLYFDYLPRIIEDMRNKGYKGPGSEKLVREAWFMLMLRAFCWWRCHSVHPGEDPSHKGSTVSSQYWDCKVPVYIG